MEPIMKLEEVKEVIKEMERKRKECIVTNAKLSEEALDWLRNQKYFLKIVGELTAIAKTEAALPTEKELEEIREEGKRKEAEAKALMGLIDILTIGLILDEIFS